MATLRYKLMVLCARMLTMVAGGNLIQFLVEPREGGYAFVTSPDLPGFSFMLEPGESDDVRHVMDALFEPVSAFLAAERAAEAKPVRLTGFQFAAPSKLIAATCPA